MAIVITCNLTFLTESLIEFSSFKDKFLWIAEILHLSKYIAILHKNILSKFYIFFSKH